MTKDIFFKNMEMLGLALTFDDIRLTTGHSEVMPDEVNLESKFSRNVPLKIPIVSAPMDTVTEHDMAIELAILGGLGIIHKNLTIEQQANEVTRVKYHLNGLISKPICIRPDETIQHILQRKKDKGYNFNTFLVVDDNGILQGILS